MGPPDGCAQRFDDTTERGTAGGREQVGDGLGLGQDVEVGSGFVGEGEDELVGRLGIPVDGGPNLLETSEGGAMQILLLIGRVCDQASDGRWGEDGGDTVERGILNRVDQNHEAKILSFRGSGSAEEIR